MDLSLFSCQKQWVRPGARILFASAHEALKKHSRTIATAPFAVALNAESRAPSRGPASNCSIDDHKSSYKPSTSLASQRFTGIGFANGARIPSAANFAGGMLRGLRVVDMEGCVLLPVVACFVFVPAGDRATRMRSLAATFGDVNP